VREHIGDLVDYTAYKTMCNIP